MTAEERDFALEHLARGQQQLLDAIDGLSAEQLAYQPASGGWSIAQVVEHLALTEEFLYGWVRNGEKAEHSGRDVEIDVKVLRAMESRKRKFGAPAGAEPTGSMSTDEALGKFLALRAETAVFVQQFGDDLRSMWTMHPVAGRVDCYTCLLMQCNHPARHAHQIAEIKQEPGFPVR